MILHRDPPQEASRWEIDQAVERVALAQALWGLPPRDREVLLLYYYQDMTTAQVARALGQREGTVRSRLARARDKLRNLLQEGERDERL